MARLDLVLIKCPMHEIATVAYCEDCCDWYVLQEPEESKCNKLKCGFTDEVLQIYHRTIDIDLDIEVIRPPQPQALAPCETVGCVKKEE